MPSRFNQNFAAADSVILEQFGEEHEWNGETIRAMPNHSQGSNNANENLEATGVLRKQITLDIPAGTIIEPYPWEEVLLDGESWIVLQALPVGNNLTVTLFQDYS